MKKENIFHASVEPICLVFSLFAPAWAEPLDRLPGKETNLVLAAPITTWDEGIPLGNGLLGGLLWGGGQTIQLSLDRGDLWDERPREGIRRQDFNYATMIRLAKEGKNDQFNAIFDYPYNGLYPTKIPAGRWRSPWPRANGSRRSELDLASAEGQVRLADGSQGTAFFSAAEPVALLRIVARGSRNFGCTPRSPSGNLVPASAGWP